MVRRLLVVLSALLPGVAGLAAPDSMVCLHHDGKIRVERFQPSCCRDEAPDPSAPGCSDKDCQDLPFVDASPMSAPDAPLLLDTCSISVEPPVVQVFFPEIPERRRPRSFSGPPPPGPERHLRTVILRR